MHTTIVKLKDGSKLSGVAWEVRPLEGWFTLTTADDQRKIRMDECESVVTEGERISKNVIDDQDMLVVWAARREEEQESLRKKFAWTMTDRGVDRHGDCEFLGGSAGVSTAAQYLFCSHCSPEPLEYRTAVIMKVRKMGWRMKKDGREVHLDVVECPVCHAQILR